MRHSFILLSHLYISAAGHLSEVFLLFQRFIDLVISHAETAQSGLDGVVGLGKDDKLGHVRDTDDLPVHLSGEVDRFLDLPTVYEPKPRNHKQLQRTTEVGCFLAATSESAINTQQMCLNKFFYMLPSRHVGGKGDTVIDKR